MKIRFDSLKEKRPTQDNGVEVLYAPSKRLAFRARWYFILFLVLLPVAFLVFTYGASLIRIEAPALVRLPMAEIRARQAGIIDAIPVRVGDHVDAGTTVVQLDNPEWRLRLAVLDPQPLRVDNTASADTIAARNRDVLKTLVQRAQARVGETQRLVARGAATRGELLSARNERDAREAELLAFERSVAINPESRADVRYQQQVSAERDWLQAQLGAMAQRAPEPGRISEIVANEGENVGPGTLLLRVERQGPAQLWIYLDPSDVALSRQGTRLTVRLPDGTEAPALVANPAESANPLPADLRRPFSSPARGLMVLAEFETPLSQEWRIDSLPVQVRFPGHLFRIPFFGQRYSSYVEGEAHR